MEIESEIVTKTMIEDFRNAEKNNEICTVILKVDNPKFLIKTKTYDIKMFGKTMTEWVANSVFDTNIKYAESKEGDDFLPIAKETTDKNSKYTFVLFSDAPLFERKTFLEIKEYFEMKNLSVLKLTRGYVFLTSYLLTIESLLNPQVQYFEEEDFITCYSLKQVSIVNEIFKNRILNYFMKNGVLIIDPASTFIDADAQIGKDTLIEPFCTIKGQTIIEENVLVNSNCVIDNSVISSNSKVSNCIIIDSFVGKNASVGEFSKVDKSKICDEVIVPINCDVNNVVVSKEDKLLM